MRMNKVALILILIGIGMIQATIARANLENRRCDLTVTSAPIQVDLITSQGWHKTLTEKEKDQVVSDWRKKYLENTLYKTSDGIVRKGKFTGLEKMTTDKVSATDGARIAGNIGLGVKDLVKTGLTLTFVAPIIAGKDVIPRYKYNSTKTEKYRYMLPVFFTPELTPQEINAERCIKIEDCLVGQKYNDKDEREFLVSLFKDIGCIKQK